MPRRESISDPASLFVDDLSAVTMGTAADMHMQDIMVLIERWEPWSNIYLNRDKSFISAIDYSQQPKSMSIFYTGAGLYRNTPLMNHLDT